MNPIEEQSIPPEVIIPPTSAYPINRTEKRLLQCFTEDHSTTTTRQQDHQKRSWSETEGLEEI